MISSDIKKNFKVYKYSIVTLDKLFNQISGDLISVIKEKQHRTYLEEYLPHIKAKTIVVEKEYIDRDFLEDFSDYYVRCFTHYFKKCWRLHFFSCSFSDSDFFNLIGGDNSVLSEVTLKRNYLGFIVGKRIPRTFIGRTCIKSYTSDRKRRHFTTIRPYSVNLFGIKLTIKSIAFQEQDSVVAACATSALWSMFHATGELFQHSIPSPVEITKSASQLLPLRSRIIPNKDGLQAERIAHAIRNLKLEPLYAGFKNDHILKGNIYSYLTAKIPLILGVNLKDLSDSSFIKVGNGAHAVAVVGYSLGYKHIIPHQIKKDDEYKFHLNASRIDKLYVHDDQVGPFARMEFKKLIVDKNDGKGKTESMCLTTSWKNKYNKIGTVIAEPILTLAGLYHKIRIPFETIHKTVIGFDHFIDEIIRRPKYFPSVYDKPLVWDIYLTNVNDLKSDISLNRDLNKNLRQELLLCSMPKYIWRATAKLNDNITSVVDLIFDATDIEQGKYFKFAIVYENLLPALMKALLLRKKRNIEKRYETEPEWMIIKWFDKCLIQDVN